MPNFKNNNDTQMNILAGNRKENKSQSVANGVYQKQNGGKPTFQFVDNRSKAIAPKKLQELADNSPRMVYLKAFQDMANTSPQAKQAIQLQAMADNYFALQKSILKKGSKTGLPGNPTLGLESCPVQMVEWPAVKKRQPSVAATKWYGVDQEDVKELYGWCTTVPHFKKIINAMTQGEWNANKQFITESCRADFDRELNLAEGEAVVTLFEFFKTKGSAPVVLKIYDPSTYLFPSVKANALMTAAGIVVTDYTRPGLAPSFWGVRLADTAHEKLMWEKEANKAAVLTIEERTQKNAAIKAALKELQDKVNELVTAKQTLDSEEAALALHNASVAAMVTLATNIPSFAAVSGNALAVAIWNASVHYAGQTGFLGLDDIIYPKATVTAATTLLHTFSNAWTATYPPNSQYLSNPHTPGSGNPQNKTGHANADIRISKFQANFIATWGGAKTVIHINSDSD